MIGLTCVELLVAGWSAKGTDRVNLRTDPTDFTARRHVVVLFRHCTLHLCVRSQRSLQLDASTAERACRRLVDRALAAGGRDNVTVVVAAYSWDTAPPPR